ncbi:MAG: bacteriorhodopsin [Phycisphaerae bacterium]
MPDSLSPLQFAVTYNLMSMAVATLAGAAIYFFASPGVGKTHKPAMLVSGVVCAIAAYHYYRIAGSFEAAYPLVSGVYTASEVPFNNFYRYADWLITVPLLMVELIAVLTLAPKEKRNLFISLVFLSAAMILLGYPGEVSTSPGVIWTFFVLSMIPFLAILGILFTRISANLPLQAPKARGLVNLARWTVVVTWSFYPIAYILGKLSPESPAAFTALQAGYTIADMTAKAGFGVVIYLIARAQTEAEEATATQPVTTSTPRNAGIPVNAG